jgi:hypothetical protein
MTEAAEIGPVEYLIVAFPGSEFRGEIAAFEVNDLDPEVREGLENTEPGPGARLGL